MNKISKIVLAVALVMLTSVAKAQDKRNMFNPINTSVTSQTIAPDARAAGMGDVGAATDPDVVSQYWNPAKYPFTISAVPSSPAVNQPSFPNCTGIRKTSLPR